MKLSEVKMKLAENPIVVEWPYIPMSDGMTRLYYFLKDPDVQGNGFYFCSIEINYRDKDAISSQQNVEILYHGWAAFDGVRHLHMGWREWEEESNQIPEYFNYPDLETLIELLQALKELQKKYCMDYNS